MRLVQCVPNWGALCVGKRTNKLSLSPSISAAVCSAKWHLRWCTREDCWMTNEQTYIDLDTHTHTRSRKKTNRHIVHSYSYGHTHTHSILLLFTLLLLYIHVTHMKLRHTSMHFKRNAIFFSLQVFLSQPIQNTYTHLKYTLAVWPAWMSQYIYHCNPFWSSSHQWALTDVDDLFPDDTNIKVWFIKSLHSGTD